MLNRFLPYFIYRRLWGDREQFKGAPDEGDSDWVTWLAKGYNEFYQNTQRSGIGRLILNLALSVVSKIDFKNKIVLEVGPGDIGHLDYMNSIPKKYVVCDVEEKFLYQSKKKLDNAGISNSAALIGRNEVPSLPFPDASFDMIISFNTLEHLYPLEAYLLEMKKKLNSKGLLVGGFPCEGGLAWGLGRFLTTRRYVHQNFRLNYDKIICWEHPNFADFIIEKLNFHFERQYFKLHPFPVLPADFNLVASFIYKQS